jgi:hypothetical protein
MSDFDNPNLTNLSHNDFSHAYRKSFWNSIFNWIRNKNNELLPYEEVLRHMPIRGQNYIGLKEIETDKIIGSVSRYLDFDRAFLPRQTHTRSRWESIDRAYFKQVVLPPIDVYKLGDSYFVKDGNHRVSVARERGQAYMDAYVTEIRVSGKIDRDTDINSLILEEEYNQFIHQTRLDVLLPNEDFHFTIPGQYEKVLQHISVHRWFMGEKLRRPVSDDEAVLGWYNDLYKPLLKIVDQHKILQKFPSRTGMDLYLWIIEHRWYLAEELHHKVSLESAATHFAESFSNQSSRRTHQFAQWIKRRIKRIFRKKKAAD